MLNCDDADEPWRTRLEVVAHTIRIRKREWDETERERLKTLHKTQLEQVTCYLENHDWSGPLEVNSDDMIPSVAILVRQHFDAKLIEYNGSIMYSITMKAE